MRIRNRVGAAAVGIGLAVLAGAGQPAAAAQTGRVRTSHAMTASVAPAVSPIGYTSDGTPVYQLVAGAYGLLAHACRVLGHDNTNQAVECADILENGLEVYAQGSGYCQGLSNPNSYPQCADVQLLLQLWTIDIAAPFPSTFVACGHLNPPCANGLRNVWAVGSGFGVGLGTCENVWAVAFGNGSESWVELPGTDQWNYATSNLASGHVYICE